MKRYLWVIIIIPLIIISVYFTLKSGKQNNYIKYYGQIKLQVMLKGLKGARNFTTDEEGNIYIAFKDKIERVKSNGKSSCIIKDNSLNIYSLVYRKNELIFASGDEIAEYNIKDNTTRILLNGIPNFGDYKETKLMLAGDNLYISVGAATNSGVAGEDNKWLGSSPYGYDITPKDITLKGNNFNGNKTGAFVPYGTKNIKNQVIPGHFPGNASLIRLNLSNNSIETFAWGLRNIEGMGINSSGKIFAAVGGIEDRGLRPVKGDYDYIYEIAEGKWYGWPDYSGGDPVNSPRFSSGKKNNLDFILENPPAANPPAPFYQHRSCSSITAMTIDSQGILGQKDSIYFYDSIDNILYEINQSGILTEELRLMPENRISMLKVSGNRLLLFDESKGCIYAAYRYSYDTKFYNFKYIYFILLLIIMSLILLLALILFRTYKKPEK